MLINVYNTSEKAIVGEWVGEWTLFLFVCGSSLANERTNERKKEAGRQFQFISFNSSALFARCSVGGRRWWSLVVVGCRWLFVRYLWFVRRLPAAGGGVVDVSVRCLCVLMRSYLQFPLSL